MINSEFANLETCNDLRGILKKADLIYIYGAGNYCHVVLHFIRLNGFDVNGILVSSLEGNPKQIEETKVETLDSFVKKGFDDNIDIIVAINNGKDKLGVFLSQYGWKSLHYVDSKLIKEILESEARDSVNELNLGCVIDFHYPDAEFAMAILKNANFPHNVLARVATWMVGPKKMVDGMRNFDCAEFREMFGQVEYMHRASNCGFTNEKACIYIATTWKDKLTIGKNIKSGYKPIQVGAAIAEHRKNCLQDDEGENISDKNIIYSECTAHYWIMKNVVDKEWVGLNHYRRRQWFDDNSWSEIRKKDYDYILAVPQFTPSTLEEYYLQFITEDDWKVLQSAVDDVAPKYTGVLERILKGHFYFPCNIMTAKKKSFDDCWKFVFSITEKIEQINAHVAKPNRYMGYITEILMSMFIMKNRDYYKIAFSDVCFIADV